MFQSSQAWQPQFDPPLPPFRTSRLESWFEEFAAALNRNNIWIQEFMYEVLEYHLPHDLKRRLTYFWSPRPYDDLRDAVLKSYGIKRDLFPKGDTAAPGSSPSKTPPALQPVQTIPLPTTGHTGDGGHPPASINPSTERPSNPEYTASAFDVPVLTPEPLSPLSVADSTPATAPCTVGFAAETCSAVPSAPSDSTIPAQPADPPADSTPVPTPVEARNATQNMDPEPALAAQGIGFTNTSAPATRSLVDSLPDHELSSNASSGSKSFQDLLATISSDLPEEQRPTICCQSVTPRHYPLSWTALPHYLRRLVKSGEAASPLCPAHDSCSVQNTHRVVDKRTVVGTQEAATHEAWSGVGHGVHTTSTTSVSSARLFLARCS